MDFEIFRILLFSLREIDIHALEFEPLFQKGDPDLARIGREGKGVEFDHPLLSSFASR
jgi:hypothetical protein